MNLFCIVYFLNDSKFIIVFSPGILEGMFLLLDNMECIFLLKIHLEFILTIFFD